MAAPRRTTTPIARRRTARSIEGLVLLNEPSQTDYDLRFSLGGIPVRIHPAFFVLPVLWGAETGSGFGLLIFIAAFFLSILVHELGHALVMRLFGESARIVLYWMGGLAISGDRGLWGGRRRERSEVEQILVSVAGPAAGLLLAALSVGVILALGARVSFGFHYLPVYEIDPANSILATNENLYLLAHILVWINLYLNLLNLLPIFPLDGGQIARAFFVRFDPWNGIPRSLWLSLATAVVAAILFAANGSRFAMFFFAFMAFDNFQQLQRSPWGGFGGRRPW